MNPDLLAASRQPRRRPLASEVEPRLHPFVSHLRDERIRLGLTQVVLSDRLGYDRNRVSRWEVGTSTPDVYELTDWAQALGYEVLMEPSCGEIDLRRTTP